MGSMVIPSLMLIAFTLASPFYTWELPAKEFVETFAKTFQMEGINIFLPESRSKKWQALSIIKHLSENRISVSTIEETKIDIMHKNPRTLYVTTASIYKTYSSNETIKFLTQNFENRKKSERDIWLFGLDNSEEWDLSKMRNILDELFQDIHVDFDDEIYTYVLETKSSKKSNSLYEVYKIHDEGAPIINQLGSWSPNDNSLEIDDMNKHSRRHDMRGFPLRITSYSVMPYVSFYQNDDGKVILDKGIFVDVFKELISLLNCSYSVILPPDNKFGALKDDGTWSGMVGQLVNKSVDFAVTSFTITEARSEVISFSNPIIDQSHAVFIQNPAASYNFDAYTSPLANSTWWMFIAWVLVTPTLLYISARYGILDQNINELTIPKSFVMVCGTFTQRGFNGVPTTWKARIAFTSFMIGGLLYYFHWEAMLISYLAKIVTPIPFSNMNELYKSDYQFTTLAGSALYESFRNGDELWQLIHKEKIEVANKYCPSVNDCVNWLLMDPKSAIYFDYRSISNRDEFKDCKIIATPGRYNTKSYAFGYQKNSPFADMFDYHIEKMRQSGVLDTITTKYDTLRQICPDLSGKPLTFGTVFTAFGIVLFGLSLSLALLLIEIITTKYGHVRCKRILNAYNYRIMEESSPIHEGRSVDSRRQLPKIDNPW